MKVFIWVVMSMIVAGYNLVFVSDKELTQNQVLGRIITPFIAWPLFLGAELHNIKNEALSDKSKIDE